MAGLDKKPQDVGDKNYSKTFSGKSLHDQEKEAANGNKSDGDVDVKTKEQTATITKKKSDSKQRVPLRLRIRGNVRNKSAFGFVVVMLLVAVWYASILSPNIILVNIKDMYMNDLADATTALSKYSVKMLDLKIGKADCGEKESIKCKLTTMSRKQVLAFQKHGFTVTGSKVDEDNLDDNDPSNDKTESRWKVTSVTFPDNGGTAVDGQSFAQLAGKSDKNMYLANGVWNPKSSFFQDARFKQRLKAQFDLQKDGGVSGQSEKEVDQSFDEALQGSDEDVDDTGHGAYSLKTLASDKASTGFTKTSQRIQDMPNSYTGVQCGFYTMGKVVYNSTKKAKDTTIARFAMQYLKLADKVKAGQADEIPTNILSSKLAWSGGGGYNGKNATDESMYRHIVLREPFQGLSKPFIADSFDVIGAFFPAWLNLTLTTNATQAITNAPGNLAQPPADIGPSARQYCLDGQTTASKSSLKPKKCPALTMAAGAAPAFAGLTPALAVIAATSSKICPRPIWLMYPTAHATSLTVMPVVAQLFIQTVKVWAEGISRNFDHTTRGEEASDAVFTGTGILLGDMAMSRGMQPANVTTLVPYLAQKKEYDQQQERISRYDAQQRPFNIYNQYSFAGSLVRSLGAIPTSSGNNNLFGATMALLGTFPSALGKTASSANAIYNLQPDEFDPSRLQCKDAEYLSIGIMADVGCNVRYSMGLWEMNVGIQGVVDYMLKPHPDKTRANITDLTQRLAKTDFERDAADVSRQLSEATEASGKAFIDKKTGAATKNSEYEKFLTYCVNREDPWGRTGLDVRRKELSDKEKQERHDSKDGNGSQVLETGEGSEYERPVDKVYMSVTEGAKGDQDWYTGKKCLENSEMLNNFRAYTMACSVDGSFAGSIDCTEKDDYNDYTDDFYTSNDIAFFSWY